MLYTEAMDLLRLIVWRTQNGREAARAEVDPEGVAGGPLVTMHLPEPPGAERAPPETQPTEEEAAA
jgi:hypothetical protein